MPDNADIKNIRIGVVGFGNMGSVHCRMLSEGKIIGAALTCICDNDEKKLQSAAEIYKDAALFADYKEMVKSGKCDAVIVAVPHFLHTVIASYAMNHGLDVLSEKPAAVRASDLENALATAEKTGRTYAVMLNQRMNPLFRKAKELVESGFIGTPKRLVWIITNWYRTQGYYDSGSWRASWNGEGGGVLMNQAPHQLDLMQWIFGMPDTVDAFLSYGKWHNISVEDDVTLFFRYKDQREAVFITSTGEYPGTNRLEISGDLGKIVLENGEITAVTFDKHEREFCYTESLGLPEMDMKTEKIEVSGADTAHMGIVQNFVNHILHGEALISPALDGLNEVNIANSAYISSFKSERCLIPPPKGLYDEMLKDRQILEKKNGEYGRGGRIVSDSSELSEQRWKVRW